MASRGVINGLSPLLDAFFASPKGEAEKAFKAVFIRYHPMVRGVLYRICGDSELEDLTQEVFMTIWRKFSSFENRSHPKTWVYRICVNKGIDHLRKKKVRKEDVFEHPIEEHPDPKSSYIEEKLLVEKALESLSEEHRLVLILHIFEELTLEDISEVLEIPVGTVKSRIYHAKQKIRAFLKQKGCLS